MIMIIKNAKVYTEQGIFENKDVYIKDDIFVEIWTATEETEAHGADENAKAEEIIDGSGCYLIPGLTDIHFHGCMGKDFCDGTEEAIQIIAEYEASVGVTTICPATMTFPEEKLTGIVKAARAYQSENAPNKEKAAILCGINMEGPFISKQKKGAQNGAHIHEPDVDMFERMQESGKGLIKIVDIAPEVDGAMEFIKAKKGEVVLSLAHSDADYDTAKAAIEAGISHVTHLYNAMNPIHHRNPGPIIAAADSETCEAELICDGVHVHPAVVRNTLKMFGEDRVIFISDSMMAAGLDDGMYELGGQPVNVKGKLALLEDGTIAGSNTNLMKCMITAVKEMNVPLETAVRCAAVNPAKAIGIYDRYGSIEPGKIANAVLLHAEDLSIKQVILKGKCI